MKYELKVEVKFQDKYNGTIYEIGEVITVDKARGDELLADDRKFVSLVEVISDEPVEVEEEVEAPEVKKTKRSKK